jgi:hypothetical protein
LIIIHLHKGNTTESWEQERDSAIAAIEGFGGDDKGRRLWKICSGYHERSLVETAMYRFKKTFGDKLKARTIDSQTTEVLFEPKFINEIIEVFASDQTFSYIGFAKSF